jgi:hypothetical protein
MAKANINLLPFLKAAASKKAPSVAKVESMEKKMDKGHEKKESKMKKGKGC